MSTRAAGRRPAGRTRPAPEWVAAGLVVVLYAGTLGVGPLLLSSATSPIQTEAPRPSPSAIAAIPSSDPLRLGIEGVLAIDARLTDAGRELKAIIGRSPFRGSEAAVVLRRIKVTLVSSGDRVAALAADPATQEIGAQLEILYANADRTVEQASNLALGSDREYREAAAEIVDLFRDLPGIDARLEDVLAARGAASAPPATSPSALAAASPSGLPSAVGTVAPASPSSNPAERLRDPGFEGGLGSWTRRATGGVALPATSAGEPLGTQGTQSLRVDVPATGSLAVISIGQGPIDLRAATRYAASVAIRADATRSAQLRVVGPAEETYGIVLIEIGPATEVARLEFLAVVDQPAAMFWIDLGGLKSGTVWLDDASLTPVTSD
ncbi:MAG TPA: hypothetical protein VGQ89_03475 [Candidatus Limnocylindrales bacterium]|nr:hypothetical protein [Candidatus Limnocylindrales bacterium]